MAPTRRVSTPCEASAASRVCPSTSTCRRSTSACFVRRKSAIGGRRQVIGTCLGKPRSIASCSALTGPANPSNGTVGAAPAPGTPPWPVSTSGSPSCGPCSCSDRSSGDCSCGDQTLRPDGGVSAPVPSPASEGLSDKTSDPISSSGTSGVPRPRDRVRTGTPAVGCRLAAASFSSCWSSSARVDQHHLAARTMATPNHLSLLAMARTGVAVMIRRETNKIAPSTSAAPHPARPARRGTPSAAPTKPPAWPIVARGWFNVSLPATTSRRPAVARRASPSPMATRAGSHRWRRQMRYPPRTANATGRPYRARPSTSAVPDRNT